MFVLLLDTDSTPVSHRQMRSQLADAARRSLSDDVKRMTPEQRFGRETVRAVEELIGDAD